MWVVTLYLVSFCVYSPWYNAQNIIECSLNIIERMSKWNHAIFLIVAFVEYIILNMNLVI